MILHCDFDTDAWLQQWGLAKAPERRNWWKPIRSESSSHCAAGHYAFASSRADTTESAWSFPSRNVSATSRRRSISAITCGSLTTGHRDAAASCPDSAGPTVGLAGGGRPVDGTDGWSARGLFEGQKDCRTPIGFYCYHMDMKGIYGSDWVWDRDRLGFLENNRWYCIEQYVKLNTPGQPDGVLRGVGGRSAGL